MQLHKQCLWKTLLNYDEKSKNNLEPNILF